MGFYRHKACYHDSGDAMTITLRLENVDPKDTQIAYDALTVLGRLMEGLAGSVMATVTIEED